MLNLRKYELVKKIIIIKAKIFLSIEPYFEFRYKNLEFLSTSRRQPACTTWSCHTDNYILRQIFRKNRIRNLPGRRFANCYF